MSVLSSTAPNSLLQTAGLSGLVLLCLSLVACSPSTPSTAVFAATDLDSIEMTSAGSIFAPIRMDEIEITPDPLHQEEPGMESDALAWIKPAPPVKKAPAAPVAIIAPREVAEQWLRKLENTPKEKPTQLAQATLPTNMGALGAGIGVNGTEFEADFKPVRKSFASRQATTSMTLASISDVGGVSAANAASTATKRVPTQREKKSLEAGDIKLIVKKQQARVRACYERVLKTETHLSGKLMMAWSVQPDGSVSDVNVADDQLGSDKVSRCVSHAVSQFRFPQGTELVQVEYPMVFEPGSRF